MLTAIGDTPVNDSHTVAKQFDINCYLHYSLLTTQYDNQQDLALIFLGHNKSNTFSEIYQKGHQQHTT